MDLDKISGNVKNIEIIDLKDNVSEFISVSPDSIQKIVGQGNNSSLYLRVDSTDKVVIPNGNYYSTSGGGSVYNFYNSDPMSGGANVIAKLIVSVV